ncbi:hypothetical protein ACFWAP_21725 [Streptomyces goshikiensis]|uniref:hypothetical protein n=1 Tax=Streptomyces goshikiensis TaxID=1942 RepID=UPI00364702EC
MRRWFRSYWDEEDTWFYFEIGDDGWVVRQVELEGPELLPVAAAAVTDRDARCGTTAELPVSEWEGYSPEWLAFEQFEEVWVTARRHLTTSEA